MTTSPNQRTGYHPLDIYGDTKRITWIFHWFIATILVCSIAGIIISLSINRFLSAIYIAACILPILATLFLVRYKKFEWASIFLAVILISLLTILATIGLGIHQVSNLGFPAVLIIASLVTRKRTMIFLTLYTIGSIAWLVFGELSGAYTPAVLVESVPGDFFSASIAILATAWMARLLTQTLFQNSQQLQKEFKERKMAEEKYSNIFENAIDGIFQSTLEGRFLSVNPSMARMYGYASPEDMIQNITDISSQIYVESELRNILRHRLAEGEKITGFELHEYRKDGSAFWISMNVQAIHDSDGNILYYEGTVDDITARKIADDVLRESEERYRTLFNGILEGVYRSSHDGRFLDVNPAMVRIFGYDSKEEMLAVDIKKALYFAPEERESLFLDTGQEKVDEFRMRRKDGSEIWVEDHGHYVHDKNGNVIYHEGILRDITERKQAEELLRESEKRYKRAQEVGHVGSWEYDIKNDTFWGSDEGKKIYGFNPETDIFTAKEVMNCVIDKDRVNQALIDLIEKNEPYNIVFDIIPLSSSGKRTINSIAELVRDENGNPIKVIGVMQDITERKRAEFEREQLIAELAVKNAEAETLRESAASVAMSLDLDETVSRILDQLQHVVPYDSASVQLLIGDELEIIGGRGFLEGKNPTGIRFVLDENDPAYPILRDGLSYILYSDVQTVSGRFKGFLHEHVLSWMAIPLYARGRLIGMFALDGFTINKFTDSHARFASTFANQVAVTLENSRLYTELQSELKKQIALRSAISAISSSLKLSEVLGEICKQMVSTINATSAYIANYDPSHLSYTVVAEYLGPHVNELEQVSDLGITYYKKNGTWIFDKTDKVTFAIVHTDDPDLTPWAKDNLMSFGGKSVLYVPLYVQSRLIGHTEIWESRRNRIFTSEEISFCQAISQQAAIAIENARLFTDLQAELAIRENLIAELESKNSELERFTYTVSHDLKSPLITIRGFLSYIELDAASGNTIRLKTDIQRISDATERMKCLLDDLLELSRIGRLKNESKLIPFEEIVHEAVELVKGRIMERNIAVHIDPNMPAVFGDRQRILEVLQNLVDNAAKFIGDQPDPRIEIGVDGEEDGKSIFYLRDNGIGITPEHHEHIFGLFNKLDSEAEGTGIGLALVKRIVEVHGGRIWVESEAGKGATFFFTLPRGND